ncbi:hypothetical protein FQA39_LY15871 [Lamprigera yunnana]|nr:hypothetical protein FQA39_LY15871 [Lamprigera yunnana]
MSGEDWSDYSSDDPEYEISDHSEMSDSDGSYSDTDDDEDIPTLGFKTCGKYPFDCSANPEAAFAPITMTEMSPEEIAATPTFSHSRIRIVPEKCRSSPQLAAWTV